MKNVPLYIMLLLLCCCNRNTNELPPFSGINGSFTKPIILFHNRSDLLVATFYHFKSPYHDSVLVCFKNISSDSLTNVHVAVEASLSLPATYENTKVYLNKTFSLLPGDSSLNYTVAADENLPFMPDNYNIYILGYDGSNGPGLGGFYENKFSLFRHDTSEITEFPQLYGFIQVDGSALFRIKISDSLEYIIPNGLFEGHQYFSGYLMSKGEILTYLSLDTTQVKIYPDSIRFVTSLLKPLSDSTNNILFNAYKY